MKVLSGELGSRPFQQPKTRSVRPLSDKVRAAIFDIVGPVEKFTVLDVYAGSGAAGFEAVSRGALLVEAIEANSRVAHVIQQNARSLGLNWGYLLHQVTVETWLASPRQNPASRRYNLIIADPPYTKLDQNILDRLGAFLTLGGVLALSHSSKTPAPVLKSIELIVAKTYGDTALSLYKDKT